MLRESPIAHAHPCTRSTVDTALEIYQQLRSVRTIIAVYGEAEPHSDPHIRHASSRPVHFTFIRYLIALLHFPIPSWCPKGNHAISIASSRHTVMQCSSLPHVSGPVSTAIPFNISNDRGPHASTHNPQPVHRSAERHPFVSQEFLP